MIRFLRRMWIPIVVVLVAVAGTATVLRLHGVFGSQHRVSKAGDVDAIVEFNQKHVLYEILGPTGRTVTVNYLDASGHSHEVDDATLPWSLPIVTTLTAVVANVVAQGDSDNLGCRITVNGQIRDQQMVSAHHAQASCLVKSA